MTTERGGQETQRELRDRLAAHHRSAHAWARHCCRNDRAEAEDVLQATYLKVLDGRARFDGRSSFTTWLFAVIRRTAADHRRRRTVRDILSLRWESELARRDPPAGPDAAAEGTQQRLRLEAALAALPRRQREVILLVFYHELTVDDAAAVMAVALGSARQHYARGKQRLRELLGPPPPT